MRPLVVRLELGQQLVKKSSGSSGERVREIACGNNWRGSSYQGPSRIRTDNYSRNPCPASITVRFPFGNPAPYFVDSLQEKKQDAPAERNLVRYRFGEHAPTKPGTEKALRFFNLVTAISRVRWSHNPLVQGSSPCSPTNQTKDLRVAPRRLWSCRDRNVITRSRPLCGSARFERLLQPGVQ